MAPLSSGCHGREPLRTPTGRRTPEWRRGGEVRPVAVPFTTQTHLVIISNGPVVPGAAHAGKVSYRGDDRGGTGERDKGGFVAYQQCLEPVVGDLESVWHAAAPQTLAWSRDGSDSTARLFVGGIDGFISEVSPVFLSCCES